MEQWFGSTWTTIGYVILSTVAIYLSAVVAIRLAGRRTLAELSAFDVVVTIALGTLVSSTAVSAEPSYAQGLAALITLLGLQVGIGALRRRFPGLQRLLDFKPETVVEDGRLSLPRGPLTSQLTEQELWSKLRQAGVFELGNVSLVVLEPTGGISISRTDPG